MNFCEVHKKKFLKVCYACAHAPRPIIFARAGTHMARDGKTYTITYDNPAIRSGS